jgi:hypothetical protein
MTLVISHVVQVREDECLNNYRRQKEDMQNRRRKESVDYRTHKVVGIIDDKAQVDAACVSLASAGFNDDMIEVFCGPEGERELDLRGESHGVIDHMNRLFHHVLLVERLNMDRYEQALLAGQCVVQVYTTDARGQEQAHGILKSHGGHYINVYGFWSMERLEQ